MLGFTPSITAGEACQMAYNSERQQANLHRVQTYLTDNDRHINHDSQRTTPPRN